jgi:hypothetical protein
MKRLLIGLLFVIPAYANAGLIVDTSVGKYDVSTITTSFSSSSSLLSSQAWFGDQTLAEEFAGLVGTNLGLPNGGFFGPFFAVDSFSGAAFIVFGFVAGYVTSPFDMASFAVASKVAEPGSLSLLAAGLVGIVLLRVRRRMA